MNDPDDYLLKVVGIVHSAYLSRDETPRQGEEGGIDVDLEILPAFAEALADVKEGQRLIVLTWLHLSDRAAQSVHPRNDVKAPLTGVFATRSPDRPNPIGLHPVTVREKNGLHLRVGPMEVLDGTPVIDLKPASNRKASR